MKTKQWKRLLCVVIAGTIAAGMLTGCQTTAVEEASGEQTPSGDSGSMGGIVSPSQAAPMDAYLNLDFGIFTLYGRPLGDWTYEELYGYVCEHFEEDLDYESESTFNGVKEEGRMFLHSSDSSNSAYIVEDRSYIYINQNGVGYGLTGTEWCKSLWSLFSYGYSQNSENVISSICGQSVERYLESICPGLYAKLQEEETIYLRDGMAMMDRLDNGMERIALCVDGGNLELGYEDGVIRSLTVIFTE